MPGELQHYTDSVTKTRGKCKRKEKLKTMEEEGEKMTTAYI